MIMQKDDYLVIYLVTVDLKRTKLYLNLEKEKQSQYLKMALLKWEKLLLIILNNFNIQEEKMRLIMKEFLMKNKIHLEFIIIGFTNFLFNISNEINKKEPKYS